MARLSKDELIQLVASSAAACGLDPAIAVVQVDRESVHFAPSVVYGPGTGTSGEKGMAQFMPATWERFMNRPHDDAYDPVLSMEAYCKYMTLLLGMFGDYERALQGYNGGEGNVQRRTVSTRAKNYAKEVMAQAQAMGGQVAATPGSVQSQSQESIPPLLVGAGIGFALLITWAAFRD